MDRRAKHTLTSDLEAQGFELIETHISWVFLGRQDVFKVKRPVDFGFLDFTSLEKRRMACEAELRLNRRLAPNVYLGVVPITLEPDGSHRIGGEKDPVEWAVHMRRLREDERADILLKGGALTGAHVDALAAHIVAFHREARCDGETSRHGTVDVIRRNVTENFEQTRETIGDYLSPTQAAEIEAWQRKVLEDETTFESRIATGRVRDGHGDLRLEHVYFQDNDSIAIIDCIEFNDRFRYADTCADIAFLSMDLTWNGRPDLAERLLGRYARLSNDYDLYSVVNFYESYRAFVRGKIASFVAADPLTTTIVLSRAVEEARRYLLLSLAFERPSLVPSRLIAVGGMIGSGKSTVANLIADLLSAPVVSSDETRKHLMGHGPDESLRSKAWTGAYSSDSTHATYEEVLRRAGVVLRSGRPAIIDASFRSRSMRNAARNLAQARGAPFLMVECVAPSQVCIARLGARGERHESDARPEIFREFAASFEPMIELTQGEHARIDTSLAVDETKKQLERMLGSTAPPPVMVEPQGQEPESNADSTGKSSPA